MATFDWIVIGKGLAGSALSYELARVGFSVLLLDRSAHPDNATRYSYGGIAYWGGSDPVMHQLGQEGIAQYRGLSEELESDTQFRELDLLLVVDPEQDPSQVAAQYVGLPVTPEVLSPEAVCAMEPRLNPQAIAGALRLPYAHVSPAALVQAYNHGFQRLGGSFQIAHVTGLLQIRQQAYGVTTTTANYEANHIAICAGGMSRSLLKSMNLPVRLYFTQAELLEIPPVNWRLHGIVMPAHLHRSTLEIEAGRVETDPLWDEPGHEVVAPILDAGAVQFRDGSLRLGQISRTLTDPTAEVDAAASELAMRRAIGQILPTLKELPGQWHQCVVAFSGDRLPLIGCVPAVPRVHLFSGFSSPFAVLPSLARRFAHQAAGQPDNIVARFSPSRFATPG